MPTSHTFLAHGRRIRSASRPTPTRFIPCGFWPGDERRTPYPAFSAYTGQQISKTMKKAAAGDRPVDVQDASIPNAQTPPEVAAWQKRQRVAQYVVPTLAGANIVLNAYLVQTYRPGAAAKGVLRRFLPV